MARDECRKYGNLGTESLCQYYECATLASIHDEHTNNFLSSLTEHEHQEVDRINWIGGIYAHDHLAWTWEDTSPFDYSRFANGENQPKNQAQLETEEIQGHQEILLNSRRF